MPLFDEYSLSQQSLLKIEKLLEKWKNENTENFVYPWDWMFESRKTEIEDENTIICIKEMLIDSQESKRKIEETLPDVDDRSKNYKKLCGLTEEQISKMKNLRKILHEPENTTSFQLLFQFLNEMSIAQIEMLCEEISLSDLPFKSLINLTKDLIASDENFGFNVMTILFKNLYLQKVYSLSQTPPQIFTDSVISLCKKYPRACCDGLLINIIKTSNLEDQQLNLINCIIQCFPEEITLLLFQEYLKICPNLNENWIKFVHNIFNLKLMFGEDVLSSLNTMFEKESENMKKSLNFARLLQLFANNYAAKLSQNELIKLQKVVSNNESILRKRLISTVNKFIE